MNNTKRVCIYTKDVMRITGKSERYCRKILTKIKVHLNKTEHQFITATEFAAYTGIDISTIETYLKD